MNLKQFTFLAFLLSVSTAALTGCGNDNSNATSSSSKLNGVEYTVVDSGSLQRTDSQLSGSGSVVFNAPLSGITSKNSYALQFTLADSGSLTLVSNSDNKLNGGVNFVFTRSGTTLQGAVKVGANTTDTFTLTGVDAAGTINLQVDVHNDETPAHILTWSGTDYAEEAAIYNSEEPGPNSPGSGTGTFWSLILNSATVNSAAVGAPKFVEGT